MAKYTQYEQQILQRYKETGNGGLIAKELNITNYLVYQCLRDNGIEPKKIGGKEKYSVETMRKMYEDELKSLAQIAEELNMKPSSIYERLEKAGIKFRSKSEALELCGHTKIPKEQEKEVIDMYNSGLNSGQIIKKLGLDYKEAVLRVLNQNNIPIRDNYGPNNPKWKGGRVPLNKLVRNSQKYVNFRKQIFEERNYICEVTGVRGGKLNMHHFKPFAALYDEFFDKYGPSIKDNYVTFNQAIIDFEPFWDKSNMIVLCEKVHKIIHTKNFGKLPIGKEELIERIKEKF